MIIKGDEEKECKIDGMRMLREEECTMNEEIGVLHIGKRFRQNKKIIVDDREGKHNEKK
jgi:hypothetical protein